MTTPANHAYAQSRVQPYTENPRYWQYEGEPVLFIGASDEDNLFQFPEEKLLAQLDELAAAGGNQIRATVVSSPCNTRRIPTPMSR